MSISAQTKEQDDLVFNQLKQTPFRTGKLKWNGRSALYAIAKDSSGNFRFQVGIQKRLYDFIYINGQLSRIRVRVEISNNLRVDGYYYFRDGEMIYKEEARPNLVDVEEAKVFAKELLQKAKTL